MTQMSVSDQIIAVINDLCTKFGIAIDWSADNVLPTIENLCLRFIKFELATSIAWCVIMILVTMIVYIVCKVFHPKAQKVNYDLDYLMPWCAGIAWIVFGIMVFSTIMVCGTQVFNIIECLTIPEKVILEYIKELLTTSS